MSKSSRLSPLPSTPALVRRTASVVVVAAAVSAVGCTKTVPPQVPPQAETAPQVEAVPPQAPPEAPQVDHGDTKKEGIILHD